MFFRIFSIISLLVAVCAVCSAQALAFGLVIVNQAPPSSAFQMVSATPYDRQVVSPAPKQYVLKFSQPVRPEKSSIKVMNSFGARVNGEGLDSDGLSLTTQLPELPPGKYIVKWQTRCQCTGEMVLSETYHFSVK